MQRLFENMNTVKRAIASRWQLMHQECPIPHAQLELLFTIRHAQPISFKQLAQQLHLTPGAISQLAEGLEKHNLISRQTDPKDRRIQCLQVSPDGLELLHRIENHRQAIMESIMTDLTDEELALWLRIHEKLLQQLQLDPATKQGKETK